MNNYKVYIHINKINGKRYYGITGKKKVEERWGKNGKGYKFYIDKEGRKRGNEHFWRSICKYGWDNFEHIVIARGLTEEEARWLEIELIREFDTTNQDKGYNITKGGEGTNGYKHTEETKKKIGEAMKGENNYRATKVYCIELDMYFESVTEASEFVGCSKSNISSVLRGKSKTAKGYHWLRAEDVEKIGIENKRVS